MVPSSLALIQMGQQPVDAGPLGQRRGAEQVLADGLGHALQGVGQGAVHHVTAAALVPFVHQVERVPSSLASTWASWIGAPLALNRGASLALTCLSFDTAVGTDRDPDGFGGLCGEGQQGEQEGGQQGFHIGSFQIEWRANVPNGCHKTTGPV